MNLRKKKKKTSEKNQKRKRREMALSCERIRAADSKPQTRGEKKRRPIPEKRRTAGVHRGGKRDKFGDLLGPERRGERALVCKKCRLALFAWGKKNGQAPNQWRKGKEEKRLRSCHTCGRGGKKKLVTVPCLPEKKKKKVH